MALDPVTAGLDLARTVVSTVWPDKSATEQAQLAAAVTIVQGQLEVNRTEAGSSNSFASGWRPFIGWCCGLACGWNWIALPAAKFGFAAYGHPVSLSPADLSDMLPLLLGMLGLGSLRTFEKVRGVAS